MTELLSVQHGPNIAEVTRVRVPSLRAEATQKVQLFVAEAWRYPRNFPLQPHGKQA